MTDAVHELLITEAALDKLGARGISAQEAEQLPRNRHVIVRNPRTGATARRLVIGHTHGGRSLTLVIEATIERATWLIITGWVATDAERKLLR